ncbi:MAG TPA: HIT family protein [Geomonas sp.]
MMNDARQQQQGETEHDSDERKDCRFCAIIRGEMPVFIVFENDDVVAFLDRRPLFPGHLLLVPREHHETLGDLPERLITPLFTSARLLARAVEKALEAEGTFVAMNNRVSQSVPHLHIHIVPRRRHDGLRGFFWPRHSYGDEDESSRIGRLIGTAAACLEKEAEGRAG